ncbi:uncharacterized protein LOC134830601 [Culicoides brevitarsis]|uniref:uncharacterized protein LOC134830601 n=1 Tax=Culicoides brevitarsis TaxID=469753 RepID=UPI00307BFB47
MSKLNREQIFNQDFVGYIKAHKCLYDCHSAEYRQRDLYNKAWEDVSKKCGESVVACRRRWRNLKTATCRYIKQLQNYRQGDSSQEHKEYYLYNDMKFVVPFLKSRQDNDDSDESATPLAKRTPARKKIKVEKPSKPQYHEYELVTADDTGDYILSQPPMSDDERESVNIIQIERDHDDSESGEAPTIVQVPAEKDESKTFTLAELTQEVTQTPVKELTPDELFLKSILPDLSAMSTEQKRKFKIRTLTLIDELLS